MALRRSPEQMEAAQQAREAASQLDAVGQAQMDIRREAAPKDNPLLVDDRRARAARRHRNTGQANQPPQD